MCEVYYIAGNISGEKDYWPKFYHAETVLQGKGAAVLNPARLPNGMESERYLPICLAMIDAADAVYMLADWRESAGACIEHAYAMYQHKKIVYEKAEVPV